MNHLFRDKVGLLSNPKQDNVKRMDKPQRNEYSYFTTQWANFSKVDTTGGEPAAVVGDFNIKMDGYYFAPMIYMLTEGVISATTSYFEALSFEGVPLPQFFGNDSLFSSTSEASSTLKIGSLLDGKIPDFLYPIYLRDFGAQDAGTFEASSFQYRDDAFKMSVLMLGVKKTFFT